MAEQYACCPVRLLLVEFRCSVVRLLWYSGTEDATSMFLTGIGLQRVLCQCSIKEETLSILECWRWIFCQGYGVVLSTLSLLQCSIVEYSVLCSIVVFRSTLSVLVKYCREC